MEEEPIEHIHDHRQLGQERRRQNARKQAQALGAFVQAFEEMVDIVRSIVINLADIPHQNRYPLVLMAHHTTMTAKPLFDVMRAVFHVCSTRDNSGFHEDQRELFNSILKQIANRYQVVVNKRNELLHGTWGFGATYRAGEDAEDIIVRKGVVTATGFEFRSPIAKLSELTALTEECKNLHSLIFRLVFLVNGKSHTANSCVDSFEMEVVTKTWKSKFK